MAVCCGAWLMERTFIPYGAGIMLRHTWDPRSGNLQLHIGLPGYGQIIYTGPPHHTLSQPMAHFEGHIRTFNLAIS